MDSRDWDARYAATDLVWGGEPNQFLVLEFTDLPPGRILDLAAGEGRNALWLAERGWQVTAVDFSAVAAARGADLAEARGVSVDWIVADLRDYRPAEAGFDAVLVAYLHLPAADLDAVLRRAVRALAPGGQILVVGHDLTNLGQGVGGPQDPSVLYTPERIVAALAGLLVERAERLPRSVATAHGPVSAIDTLVRASKAPRTDRS